MTMIIVIAAIVIGLAGLALAVSAVSKSRPSDPQEMLRQSMERHDAYAAAPPSSPAPPAFPEDPAEERIARILIERFLASDGIDLAADAMAMERIRAAARIAKQELETKESCQVELPFIYADKNGPKHLSAALSKIEIY